MHGFLLIDKPRGISSNGVLTQIKRQLHIKKMGHTGTLDPFALGLLVAASGEATKFFPYLEEAEKEYQAVLKLGVRTDTLDDDGVVLETKNVPSLNTDTITEIFASLIGKQTQVPPMYSAKKIDGKELYKLARKGIEVERAPCAIEIKQLNLLEKGDDWIKFEVICSKGTYVRVLGETIAESLGSVGHLNYLRRMTTNGFHVREALNPEKIDTVTIPIEKLNQYLRFPTVKLDEAGIKRILLGNFVSTTLEDGIKSVLNMNDEFCGLVKSDSGLLKPERMVITE